MTYPQPHGHRNASFFQVYTLQTLPLMENIHSLYIITIIGYQLSPVTM